MSTAAPGNLKAMDRRVWEFALVSVAVRISMREGKLTEARIACGGVANVPHRAPEAEGAGRLRPSDALFSRAVTRAVEGASPLAKNGYKVSLLRDRMLRALNACTAAQ